MCVSETRNCVKYWAMCTLSESDERSLICDSRAYGVCVCANVSRCVCACLCMHTSANFTAVLMRSRKPRRCVCEYEYELSSPVSDHRLKERKRRGEYLFQTGEIPLYEDKYRMRQPPERISQLKTFSEIH